MFLGAVRLPASVSAGDFGDLAATERVSIVPLLILALIIGIAPRFLLDVVEPAGRTLVELVAR
jgi:NADH-quinone oxidoreductase subunit M